MLTEVITIWSLASPRAAVGYFIGFHTLISLPPLLCKKRKKHDSWQIWPKLLRAVHYTTVTVIWLHGLGSKGSRDFLSPLQPPINLFYVQTAQSSWYNISVQAVRKVLPTVPTLFPHSSSVSHGPIHPLDHLTLNLKTISWMNYNCSLMRILVRNFSFSTAESMTSDKEAKVPIHRETSLLPAST